MNFAGYRNFTSFGKSHYFKIGTRLWMIKVFGKNAFYKLFNNMLRPFSALNFSYSYNQLNQDSQDDKRFIIEFIQLPFSQFANKQIREIMLTQKLKKHCQKINPFIYKEGLDALNKERQDDNGMFKFTKNKINNPMAMDQFSLDEVETVISDYDIEECNTHLQESMILSSVDSLYDSSTDTSVY